jgi:N-acetylglutamate synthase-like GNAT family acetyltransferase
VAQDEPALRHGSGDLNMKPLLIIPPAPARWPALRELPLHDALVWQEDLEKRFAEGIPGSQDAFALVSDGGLALGCAAVSKRHDLGILTRLFVRPEHRERGLARQITESLVSWFDMAGGKWLYATTTADVAEGFFRRFAFSTLRRAPRAPHDAVLLLRATGDVPPDPLSTAVGTLSIHDLSRANWPSLAALLYNRPGPDPRVPLDESAVTAELTALQLLSQQEAGTCQL